MKAVLRVFFPVIGVALLVGCSSGDVGFEKPNFKEAEEAEFEILGEGKFGFGYISDMGYYKQNIFVLAGNAETRKCLHLFDLNGEETVSALFKGRGAKEKLWYSNIAVFDWNCKPVKLIKTDCRIERICTNEDETALYAVVSDKDKRCFIGKISL